MTTMSDHIRQLEGTGVRRSYAGPRSNIDANYNTAPFGMNNYVVEVTPSDAELGSDIIEKYKDDSPADKAFNRKLLTRQKKPETIETPALATNPNDNLEFLITGSKEK